MDNFELFVACLIILFFALCVIVLIDMAVPNSFCDNTPQEKSCEDYYGGKVSSNSCWTGVQCSLVDSDVIRRCDVVKWGEGYALDC